MHQVNVFILSIDLQSGVTVRYCLKVYSCVRDKWLLFCCRTAEEKRRWLMAMAEERRLVAQDRSDGLEFPAAARQLARLAANRQQNRPPIKPRSKYLPLWRLYSVNKIRIYLKKNHNLYLYFIFILCLKYLFIVISRISFRINLHWPVWFNLFALFNIDLFLSCINLTMLQTKRIKQSRCTRCLRQWSVKAPRIRWDGRLGPGSCSVATRKARGFNRPETGLPSYRILTCKAAANDAASSCRNPGARHLDIDCFET